MTRLTESFDAATLPTGSGSYEPLPAGWYDAAITEAELKTTKDGGGQYIKVRYDITGPTHQGRVVFGNLNIKNASAKAEEIGRQQLGELMRAVGLPRVTDTDQLIGGRLSIKLTIRAGRTDALTGSTYEPSNEVRGYRAIAGGVTMPTMPQAAAGAAAAAPAAPARAAPPWAKK